MSRRSRQIEVEGLKQVERDLARLGWRSVETPSSSDVGTDLFADLFDDRGHSLRLHIGVQVKSGDSYFKRRRRSRDRGTAGWWFRERSKRHFDYWTTYPVPHVLVLADVANEVAYWVHVTAEEVKPTGRGAKILVPQSQTLTSEHAEALAQVAAAQRAVPRLEGLAFAASVKSLPLNRRLRYALMVPRLVIPLRYAGFDQQICAEEAIALVAHGRFRDLLQYADSSDAVPHPENTDDDAAWQWRLAAALWHWAVQGADDQLRAAHEAAPDDSSKAASGVLLACALQRAEQHHAAIAVLDSLVGLASLEPVDLGWVLVQRARTRSELGDWDGAQADASLAQRYFVGDYDDITVSALRAAAAWILYHGAWMNRFNAEGNIEDQQNEQDRYQGLLTAFDTAVSWWRSQEVSAALTIEQDECFRSWSQDDPDQEIIFRWSGEDQLFAAELNADLTGEHGVWSAVAERRGLRLLMCASKGDDEVDELAEGLDVLRRCGRRDSLGRAIGHLLRIGPADALAQALHRLPKTAWTRTTVAANFKALELAGQFLDEGPAGELLLSCTRYARGDAADLPRCDLTPPGLIMAALDGASGLMTAASDALHSQVARDLADLPPNAEHAYSLRIENVIDQLKWNHVDSPDRESLRELARRGNPRAAAAVLGWLAANGDDDAQSTLQSIAATGDLYAVSALPNLDEVNDSDARDLLNALRERARAALSDARSGTYGGERNWAVGAFVHGCATFPRHADWDSALALLADPSVATATKRVLCAAAVRLADRIPGEIKQQLVSYRDLIAQSSPIYLGDGEIGAMHTRLLYALGALSDAEAEAALIDHAVGKHLERRDAAHLAHSLRSDQGDIVLAMLARDHEFSVRANAAYWIGRRVASSESRALDASALRLAHSDATSIQLSLLNGMNASDTPRLPVVNAIAEHLNSHPSARVRRGAAELENGPWTD